MLFALPNDRKLRARPVDLVPILAQAVEANGPYAAERQVLLAMTKGTTASLILAADTRQASR